MDKWSGSNATAGNSSVDRWPSDARGSRQLEPGELRVLVPALLGVLCVLGVACNLTAVGILFSSAQRGKLSLINSLIFNLMLADGLVLGLAVPFRAASYSRAGWRLGWALCKTSDWFLQSCMAAKSFTLAVLAHACYRYVSNPTKQVSIRLGSILVVLLLLWLCACSVTVPHWLFAALQRDVGGGLPVCAQLVPPEARDFMAVYAKAYPLGVYCAPLSAALVFFCRAYRRCQQRASKTQNLRTQIRSKKLTLMLFGLTVAMAVLWLPQWVLWVWERHVAERELEGAQPVASSLPPLLVLSAQLLTFSLSLVSPLIVLSLSEEFREGYRGLWRRLTLRKHPPPKPKPGPHTATSLQSPCPRPETSGRPGGDTSPRSSSGQGPSREAQAGGGGAGGGGGGEMDADRLSLKDGIVLPDVEQFWHERESGPHAEGNDPVPWEHQNHEEGNT
ncbi:putative G-protein coupled receptor 151 [Liparis tanakae]|uniref:GPCR-2037 n=1 Tax=Liparis tanakae TaxID=230148 RepID=A0A4Z2EYH2_9TELE|nr:putative G-protein coupled receptor 151 [Liparis tanakae]